MQLRPFTNKLYQKFGIHKKDFNSNIETAIKQAKNLIAFLEANPTVKKRKSDHSACFHTLLQTGGNNPRGVGYIIIDHQDLWKTSSRVKDVFMVGQPYRLNDESQGFFVDPDDDEILIHEENYSAFEYVRYISSYINERDKFDLIAKILPKKYSWYLPDHSYLIFLGRPEIIKSLNFDYGVDCG